MLALVQEAPSSSHVTAGEWGVWPVQILGKFQPQLQICPQANCTAALVSFPKLWMG